MNEIAKQFLLPADKFMPKMHLKQLDLHVVLVEHLPKNKERIQTFKETGDF